VPPTNKNKPQIEINRVYRYPIERVWQALTDRRALATWLVENDFEPEVGRKFQFRTKPQPGFSGIIECEVLVVEPPHRLVYTWQGGPLKKPTTVSWTLDKLMEDRTLLTLEHNGFSGAGGTLVRLILGAGWNGLLGKELEKFLAGSL
jgi:uncharacterized protein YndB with AHSA1/START domain